MPISPGTRLGPYEIIDAIGAGGMGEVYRARDAKLKRDVAIKVLPPAFAADGDRLERFEREAQSLAALNHPHVAQIYGILDLPAEGGGYALVMELVEGEDLSARIARGAIPLPEALPIARQIAEALDCAHERGIVHRDLKPANVKLRADGTVKVLDFGLAKDNGAVAAASGDGAMLSPTFTSPAMTQMGIILGTAAYMAPEQAKGKPVDKRADIWAFGCVLYEMLSGARPFPGSDVSDTLASVLARDVDWSALPADTPPHVRAVMRRCLQKDPKMRMRDIGDARLQLEEPIPAEIIPPAVAPRSRLFALVPWGIAALAVMAAIAAFSSSRGAPATDGQPVRMLVTGPDVTDRPIRPALAPDGSFIVFQADRLYIRRLSEFTPVPLPGTESAEMPFVSPDSKWIGFFANGKIRKIAIAGGDPIDVCTADPDSPGASWGANNRIYFSPGWSGVTLMSVPADGGTPAPVSALDASAKERGHWQPQPLPDGRHLLFTLWYAGAGLSEARIGLLDLQTGKHRALIAGANPRYTNGRLLYYHAGGYKVVPFDPAALAVTGEPRAVLPDAMGLHPQGSSMAPITVASNGTIAYMAGELFPEVELTWVHRDGRQQPTGVRMRIHDSADLSADGRRVAFGRPQGGTTQLVVADLEGGGEQRFSVPGMNWAPVWHPDGERLAHISMRKGDFDSYIQRLDGSREEVLESGELDDSPSHFLRDGSALLSKEWRPDGSTAIVRTDLASRTRTTLVGGTFAKGEARSSPDGRWLAVVANPSGAWHVHVRPLAGDGGVRQVTPTSVLDYSDMRWSPRGTELFFFRELDLVAMTLEERGGVLVGGTPKLLAAVPGGARLIGVSPDGARVLVAKPPPSSAPRGIRVIINGLSALSPQ